MAIMAEAEARAQALRSMHRPGKPVVFTNVYDPPTTRFIASHPGSEAIATASFAIAAVNGLEDDDLDLATNLAVLRRLTPIALEHNKPITADLQDGYGEQLEEAITSIVKLGVSGCNLEDRDNNTGELFPIDVAASRIRQARAAAEAAGVPSFVVNARTDAILLHDDIDMAIERGKAYLASGATTVFVWGGLKRGLSRAEVIRLCDAFEGRLNVIARLTPDGLSISELASIGVARISMGPALWRHAMAAFQEKATENLQQSLALR
ncbi:putative carboxyphosphonoenolpyruvate mutase [Xylogone sp. PMI_703]|nr:putative carboxyphosphonoenolpyruvate mutase [Xylogone sp. PMI_703]